MGEVNNDNFKEKFPEIKASLERAKFIAVDLEFSALHPLKSEAPSLFDTPVERYTKLRKNIEILTPIQVGLTAFDFDVKRDKYSGTIYNFYILPASFPTVEKSFVFESNTLSFLKANGFDFNKLIYNSIPYINEIQASDLRKRFLDESITDVQSNLKSVLEEIYENQSELLQNWIPNADIGETLTLPDVFSTLKGNHELQYFVQKHFRSKYKHFWTEMTESEFLVRRLALQEVASLRNEQKLEEELLDKLLGFTKVFRLLVSLKKPLVGHNLLQDLLMMYNSFYEPLPESYHSFKKQLHNLLPNIFDTKIISLEIKKSMIPEEKQFNDRGLASVFEYFKDGKGRHLVLNSPPIEAVNKESYGKYHEAGWDSFCTGYVFVRLAYLNIYEKYPKSKRFVSSELIGGLFEWKNKVNVIRASVSHLILDGEDPVSTRPPYLVIESIRNKPVNISQLTSILSSFGFVEVRKMPHSRMALVAVDNFGNARRILKSFQTSTEFNATRYSPLKHSPTVRALLLSSLTVTGALILWATHAATKR